MTKIMLQLHTSRISSVGFRYLIYDVKNLHPMHDMQKMEGMEPGFVSQGIITSNEFRGSMLDLLQAYNIFEQPGSPELGTVTQLETVAHLRTDQRQVEMQVQRR